MNENVNSRPKFILPPGFMPSYEQYLQQIQQPINEAEGGYDEIFTNPFKLNDGVRDEKKTKKSMKDLMAVMQDGVSKNDDDEEETETSSTPADNSGVRERQLTTGSESNTLPSGASVTPSPSPAPSNDTPASGASNKPNAAPVAAPTTVNKINQPTDVTQVTDVDSSELLGGVRVRSWADRTRDKISLQMDLARAKAKGDIARNSKYGKVNPNSGGLIGDVDDATFNKMKENRIKDATEREQRGRVARAGTNVGFLERYKKENPNDVDITPEDAIAKQRVIEQKRSNEKAAQLGELQVVKDAQAKNEQNARDREKYGGDPNERIAGTDFTREAFYKRTGRAFGGDLRRDSDEAGRMRAERKAAAEDVRKKDREEANDVVNQTVGEGIPLDAARSNAKNRRRLEDEEREAQKKKAIRMGSKTVPEQPTAIPISAIAESLNKRSKLSNLSENILSNFHGKLEKNLVKGISTGDAITPHPLKRFLRDLFLTGTVIGTSAQSFLDVNAPPPPESMNTLNDFVKQKDVFVKDTKKYLAKEGHNVSPEYIEKYYWTADYPDKYDLHNKLMDLKSNSGNKQVNINPANSEVKLNSNASILSYTHESVLEKIGFPVARIVLNEKKS